jgi:hypothetical protein
MPVPAMAAESSLYPTIATYRAEMRIPMGSYGGVVPVAFHARRVPVSGRGLAIGGVHVDGGDVCACLRVCDGQGNNCTPCSCDPPGCGSC